MPPRRLFAGRPPPDLSSSSSDENPDTPAAPSQSDLAKQPTSSTNAPPASVSSPPRVPAQRRKRPRFVARVVSQDLNPQGGVKKAVPDDNDLQKWAGPVAREAAYGGDGGEREGRRELDVDSESESDGDDDDDDDDDEEEEDEEGEAEEDIDEIQRLERPVFISKAERGAAQGAQELEQSVDRMEKRELERREEARRMVHAALEEEEENLRKRMEGGTLNDEELPDDEDIEEEREKEYALWRVRELKRIVRDKQEVEEWKRKRSGGASAVERTDEALQHEEGGEEHGGEKVSKESGERARPAFLQKFYKMGPFFLETDESGRYKEEIYNRDYNRGTSEDGVNREALPAPMQVRRGEFGKAGRSKYTHLANEDTAAGLAGELRRDKELADALGAGRKNGAG
eukprot:GFKZ01004621.1.p1 GENE.GFKZ01004621.1~~GFKZ01004621.1.p1  ORF type:complete len:400 (+),score=118.74 GFKZ01004621.1:128-1327(+)